MIPPEAFESTEPISPGTIDKLRVVLQQKCGVDTFTARELLAPLKRNATLGAVLAINKRRYADDLYRAICWLQTERSRKAKFNRNFRKVNAEESACETMIGDGAVPSDTVDAENRIHRAVRDFANTMETQLLRPKNMSKGNNWESCEIEWLTKRVTEEVLEVFEAIQRGARASVVRAECADVANMAMMVAECYEAKRLSALDVEPAKKGSE